MTSIRKLFDQIKSDRKRQLFVLACCKSIEHLMFDQRSKDYLKKIEFFIDEKIDKEELEIAEQSAWTAVNWVDIGSAYYAARSAANARIKPLRGITAISFARSAACWADEERTKQLTFLKDIYNPNLLDLTFPQKAIELAEEVYDTNNTTTRLILSDFLEEFNFPEELYLHLKQHTHHKGCWVIDQILEKS